MSEKVFAERAAVPTLSPAPLLYFLGYGGVLVLGVLGIWVLVRELPDDGISRLEPASRGLKLEGARILLPVWAIMNFISSYFPVAFQRKMIMGEHIALGLLAGLGFAWILRGFHGRRRNFVIAIAIGFLALTNVRFLARDVTRLAGRQTWVRPFMYTGEVRALQWLKENGDSGSAIQPLPWIAADDSGSVTLYDLTVACFTPGVTGHPVNVAHWSETPHFSEAVPSVGTIPAAGNDRRAAHRSASE
jgi:hypothetical protein